VIVGITCGGDQLPARIAAALEAGIDHVLVREPALPDGVATLALAWPGRLVLHARMAGAEALSTRLPVGLHLSATMPVCTRPGVWSVSTHSVAEARRARDAGAAWVLLSPIWRSPSKPGDERPPLGIAVLGEVAGAVALGGVDPSRVAACRDAGAHGVAGMGGLFGVTDIRAAVTAWQAAWGRADERGA
jgi:thiamine-phosphate pyrophosphorylase